LQDIEEKVLKQCPVSIEISNKDEMDKIFLKYSSKNNLDILKIDMCLANENNIKKSHDKHLKTVVNKGVFKVSNDTLLEFTN